MAHLWRRSLLTRVLAGVLAFFFAGCGASQIDNAPDGSTISFNPSKVTLTPLGTEDCSASFAAQPRFDAVLRNSDGAPLNDVPVTFRLTTPFLNFVASDGTPIANRDVTVRTNINGIVSGIRLDVAFCQFKSQLEAVSGTAFNVADIEVTAAGSGTNQPPVAVAAVNPTTGNSEATAGAGLGTAFDFDASGSSDADGTIVTWDWDFGNGDTATGETTTYTFPSPCTPCTVTLTVTDDNGDTGTDTLSVTVN